MIGLGRYLTDITANAALFLASDEARFVTGTEIGTYQLGVLGAGVMKIEDRTTPIRRGCKAAVLSWGATHPI
ncbi:hypothetical protein B6V74_18335 [Thioclava sp. F42-5]|nr:hypothetical protein B6V74_18335 [Thioclava sp. F42-5]